MTAVLSDRVRESAAFLHDLGVGEPVAAVVLGSGLSGALEVEGGVSIPYAGIPGFLEGRVAGHDHRLEFGRVAGRPILVLRGRAHYYEGASLADATFPIRVVRALAPRWLAVLNAAGGIHPDHRVGDIVLLSDHLNWMGDNPLIGPNDERLGDRFPDLSEPYDRTYLRLVESCAMDLGIRLQRGVFVAVAGPNLETAAEYRFLRAAGADVVGMSLIPETLVAVHSGMRVLALTIVTDECFPDRLQRADVARIIRVANEAEPALSRLVEEFLRRSANR